MMGAGQRTRETCPCRSAPIRGVVQKYPRRLGFAPQRWVELVSQAIAHKIRRHDHQGDGHPGEEDGPPGLTQVIPRIGKHTAPGRSGRTYADGQEGEGGFQQDETPQLKARHDENGGHGIG